MRIPLFWLREYVDVRVSPEELSHRLTMAGTEASVVKEVNWNKVRVGQVLEVRSHPAADRLKLVKVRTDHTEEDIEVVCGAPNIADGQKIAFASLGAILVDGKTGKPGAKLKRTKIRGVVSEGMICSSRELGLGDDHDSILVLPEEAKPGAPLEEVLGRVALELQVTPNRPDCFSVLGVAREVAALTQRPLNLPSLDYESGATKIKDSVSVTIASPRLCRRYMAALVQGVVVKPSPDWLKKSLEAAGERPINNIVDITNYVMLETGQPLHAFDADMVTDGGIVVRTAKRGEHIVTLDGVDRELSDDVLLIADTKTSIGVAGVMGGEGSEIRPDTANVLIEAASFDGVSVRRTAKKLGIQSQAALRFEKDLRSDQTGFAIRRAIRLILQVAGGVAASGLVDEWPGKGTDKAEVSLARSDISRVLGLKLEDAAIDKAFRSFGFTYSKIPEGWNVIVPWWRPDISIPEDLCEEVARFIGYDSIPARTLEGKLPEWKPHPELQFKDTVVDALVQAGLQETISYSATSEEVERRAPINNDSLKSVTILNPVSAERAVMRKSLRASVIDVAARNSRISKGPITIFECGKVFFLSESGVPQEKFMAAGILAGPRTSLRWDEENKDLDFYDAKGVVEFLLAKFGEEATFKPSVDPSLTKGKTATIVLNNTTIGVLGEVAPNVLQAFDTEFPSAVMFELDLEVLQTVSRVDRVPIARPPPRMPEALRDIAVIVKTSVNAAGIVDIAMRNKFLKGATIFDVYQGEKIRQGMKSVAVRLTFQSENKTLTSRQLDKEEATILRALKRELGATIRAEDAGE